jgi:hypothetical protein
VKPRASYTRLKIAQTTLFAILDPDNRAPAVSRPLYRRIKKLTLDLQQAMDRALMELPPATNWEIENQSGFGSPGIQHYAERTGRNWEESLAKLDAAAQLQGDARPVKPRRK